MKLTLKQKQLVKEYARKLVEAPENEFMIYAVDVSGNESFPGGGNMVRLRASDFKQAWIKYNVKVNDLDLADKEYVNDYVEMLKEARKYGNRLAITPDDSEAFVISKGPMSKKEAKDILRKEFGGDQDDDEHVEDLF